jgi:hypothetical protein
VLALEKLSASAMVKTDFFNNIDPKRTLGKISWGRRQVQNPLSFFQQSFGT